MADQTVYDFGSGKPSPKTFPSAALGRAAQRVLEREGPMLSSYPEAKGYTPLREIGVQRFAKNHGVQVPLGDVVTTNGSMQSIILATQAFSPPGDTVLVEEYCYSGTLGVLRQFGARVEGVALDDSGMRADALEAALEKNKREGRRVGFVYSIATHQNPTGTIMPLGRRHEIVEVCRRHQVLLVEDDCYADVVFEGEMPPAMYTMADPGTCVYIGSFSKILGPGVRLGYFISPEALTNKMLAFKKDGGTSNLSSMVVAEYMKDELWTHAAEVCDAVRAKRDMLFSALEREMGGLVEWTRPNGGLFTWLKLPEGIDTKAIASLAKERNLLYATGKAFDAADRDVPFLRLAFGYIDDELIDDGISLLGECIEGAAPGAAVTAGPAPALAAR
jgi:2-aminoadipate transaminase